jgi:hypothetical protein
VCCVLSNSSNTRCSRNIDPLDDVCLFRGAISLLREKERERKFAYFHGICILGSSSVFSLTVNSNVQVHPRDILDIDLQTNVFCTAIHDRWTDKCMSQFVVGGTINRLEKAITASSWYSLCLIRGLNQYRFALYL